jgi:flagellar biogenesis protein FliO
MADPISTAASAPAADVSVLSSWMWLFALTGLVVLASFLFVRFQRKGPPGTQKVDIRLLGMRRLGPREAIVVAEIDGRKMVLGHTAASVNFIAELSEPKSPSSHSEPVQK